ncbi:hypothetical protein CEXT_768021 [Caerostris extrusa]|uniref:Uncharacterized protein n=1 Tax=Caerostris extrusa TaxID=172846 RepID=A0AAV4QVY3_CAEEX|nr:hypothetical protein CEXT_768021 [Caerostris extrusa]
MEQLMNQQNGQASFNPYLTRALIQCAISAEKVLFGQPAPIAAEGRQIAASDAAKDITPKDGRKARVFTFRDLLKTRIPGPTSPPT